MPYLAVKLCAAPSAALAKKIAEALTALTHEVLRKKRELTAVTVEYVAPSRWFVGGAALAGPARRSFFLEIKVTEGTNSKDEKAAYVAAVFAAMKTLLGAIHPASYVVIQDVGADAWGYGGLTQERRAGEGRPL